MRNRHATSGLQARTLEELRSIAKAVVADGYPSGRKLALVAVTGLAIALALAAAAVLISQGSSTNSAVVQTTPTVVTFEILDEAPISVQDALQSIDEGVVFRIALRPDHHSTGISRWYQLDRPDAVKERWKVKGVDIVLFIRSASDPLDLVERPMLADSGLVGADEDTLQRVTLRVFEYNEVASSPIQLVDDREWWAQGKPFPHEPVFVLP